LEFVGKGQSVLLLCPFNTSLKTTLVFSSSCPKISATALRRIRLSLDFSLWGRLK